MEVIIETDEVNLNELNAIHSTAKDILKFK